MSSQKATPDYNGLPPELHERIFSNLNVLDRSIMKQVSSADQALADKQPSSINTVEVFAGDADPEARISVQDTEGAAHYDVIPLAHFAQLLENRSVEIGRLTVSGGRSEFAENFRRLVESVRQVPRGTVRVKELMFASDKYDKKVEKDGKVRYLPAITDTTRVLEIRNFLELFVAHHLEKIHIQTLFSDEVWMEIVKTEQWRNAKTIEIERGLNLTLPLFDTWNGMHLRIKIGRMTGQWTLFTNHLDIIFRHKPIGASFVCDFLDAVTLIANLLIIRKIDTVEDPTKRLYSFRGTYFVRGFVQPNDGTPGELEIPRADEQRHILWANL